MIDYLTLSRENKRKYGTDIGRIGRMLLTNRYSDRSHFIYELLQNAEDALKRRPEDWKQRTVKFELTGTELTISHFGALFTEQDVRGVCGIDDSTKDSTQIGRFGIGFKSVNAYTDRPEVHSGTAHFAIERYVHPVELESLERQSEKTQIILPFCKNDPDAFCEIAKALKCLGIRTLLFLRQIESIEWSITGEGEGVYLRGPRRPLGFEAELITIAGEDKATSGDSEEDWIVFSQPVKENGVEVGHAELAFLVEYDHRADSPIRVLSASNTELVVYFPTIVATDVGFLIQGPYRTTPSRDNVVRYDPWNHRLVEDTARLLVSALKGLRGLNLLDTNALGTLPIHWETFDAEHMFSQLFKETRGAFQQHRLLPSNDGDYITSGCAKLVRGKELQELLEPQQLSSLFAEGVETKWLDGGITSDRTPELRNYLIHELGIKEITPETAVRRMDVRFLEEQTDAWVETLYVFLAGQPNLRSRDRLTELALIRLEDGSHVPARDSDGRPRAFLPGSNSTEFLTVCEAVCRKVETLEFLGHLGLSEPDLVDDVTANVLPRYSTGSGVSGDQYASDVKRILKAFETDSSRQRERMVETLSKTPFVAAFDAASKELVFARPGEVYIASDRLSELFEGVEGVLLVSDIPILKTESSRNMLVAAGAARYLTAKAYNRYFTHDKLAEMRKNAGWERNTGTDHIKDHTLRGLDGLLELLPKLDIATARRKAFLLWEALCDIEERSFFWGTYRWFYQEQRGCHFDAEFVERLRSFKWIADKDGVFHAPGEITFKTLDWKENPILMERLRFKPSHLDQLALDAGFEPQVLSLLKQYDLTTEAQLRKLLDQHVDGEASDDENDSTTQGDDTQASGGQNGRNGGDKTGVSHPKPITYIHVRADDDTTKDGGKAHAERMELEECGIRLILEKEPDLQRTRINNPGFDLVEKDAADRELRWVEVKAISGAFDDRWVGLYREQFETAMFRESDYWLYVVEHAATPDLANIIQIPDPARQVKTFVFDHGWRALAMEPS